MASAIVLVTDLILLPRFLSVLYACVVNYFTLCPNGEVLVFCADLHAAVL
jgi:hypothetical protein